MEFASLVCIAHNARLPEARLTDLGNGGRKATVFLPFLTATIASSFLQRYSHHSAREEGSAEPESCTCLKAFKSAEDRLHGCDNLPAGPVSSSVPRDDTNCPVSGRTATWALISNLPGMHCLTTDPFLLNPLERKILHNFKPAPFSSKQRADSGRQEKVIGLLTVGGILLLKNLFPLPSGAFLTLCGSQHACDSET